MVILIASPVLDDPYICLITVSSMVGKAPSVVPLIHAKIDKFGGILLLKGKVANMVAELKSLMEYFCSSPPPLTLFNDKIFAKRWLRMWPQVIAQTYQMIC